VYYQFISENPSGPNLASGRIKPLDKSFFVDLMCLDRKISTHFSQKVYSIWCFAERMMAQLPPPTHTATGFNNARDEALRALGDALK
jgi:hypothetical protein